MKDFAVELLSFRTFYSPQQTADRRKQTVRVHVDRLHFAAYEGQFLMMTNLFHLARAIHAATAAQ